MENNRKIIESINFSFQKFFIKTEKLYFKTLIIFFKNTFQKVYSLLSPDFIQLFLANCKFIQLIIFLLIMITIIFILK